MANGDKFSDFVKEVADSPKVKAIGINCTSPKYIKSLLEVGEPFRNDKAFVVYPNSGEKYDGIAKEYVLFLIYSLQLKTTIIEFFRFYGNVRVAKIIEELDEWVKLGVRVIGGCCRVTPDDIKRITNHVRKIT